MQNAVYFKINIFDVRINPLRTVYLGCSGLYKIGEKTEAEAHAEVIIPLNGVAQVVYLDKDLIKVKEKS